MFVVEITFVNFRQLQKIELCSVQERGESFTAWMNKMPQNHFACLPSKSPATTMLVLCARCTEFDTQLCRNWLQMRSTSSWTAFSSCWVSCRSASGDKRRWHRTFSYRQIQHEWNSRGILLVLYLASSTKFCALCFPHVSVPVTACLEAASGSTPSTVGFC